MRKVINVAALILVLTFSAHGGEMQNGLPTPPPTPPQHSIEQPTMAGDIHYPLIQLALNLLALL